MSFSARRQQATPKDASSLLPILAALGNWADIGRVLREDCPLAVGQYRSLVCFYLCEFVYMTNKHRKKGETKNVSILVP